MIHNWELDISPFLLYIDLQVSKFNIKSPCFTLITYYSLQNQILGRPIITINLCIRPIITINNCISLTDRVWIFSSSTATGTDEDGCKLYLTLNTQCKISIMECDKLNVLSEVKFKWYIMLTLIAILINVFLYL